MARKYTTEFNGSDFAIPSFVTDENGWTDESWHNDICPSFHNTKLELCLWVSETDEEKRDGRKRFILEAYSIDKEVRAYLLATNDSRELSAYIARYPYALQLAEAFSKFIRSWLTPSQLAEVNANNEADAEHYGLGRKEYGSCATHDYCDSNEAMLLAFNCTFKRDPWTVLDRKTKADDKNREKDTALMNEAWTIAKAHKFEMQA